MRVRVQGCPLRDCSPAQNEQAWLSSDGKLRIIGGHKKEAGPAPHTFSGRHAERMSAAAAVLVETRVVGRETIAAFPQARGAPKVPA